MYTKVTDINDIDSKYDNYKLCYIDSIPEYVWKLTPESERIIARTGLSYGEYMNSPERQYLECRDYPNPDFVEGKSELLAYFTPRFGTQKGEDWDKMPYEHNGSIPYDRSSRGGDYEILMVPFATRSFNTVMPHQWFGCEDSMITVNDINGGAIAWIYDAKEGGHGVAIYGGDTLKVFRKKLERMHKDNKELYEYPR